MRKFALSLMLFAASTAVGQQHINAKKGFNAENTYDLLGMDSVNLFSGNLVLSMPLGLTYLTADRMQEWVASLRWDGSSRRLPSTP